MEQIFFVPKAESYKECLLGTKIKVSFSIHIKFFYERTTNAISKLNTKLLLQSVRNIATHHNSSYTYLFLHICILYSEWISFFTV